MKILILITFLIFENSAIAQVSDTFHYAHDTVTIKGTKYSGSIYPDGLHLLKSNSKTTLKIKGSFSQFEFKDMNNDGYKDVVLYNRDRVAKKILLFVPRLNRFE